MANIMFDTNIFNRILDGKIDLDELKSEENKYYSTHIQWDELNKCPDKKRKKKLLEIFNKIEQKVIATESSVSDVSKFDLAKYGDGELFEEIRKGNLKHNEDALIGETAIKQGMVLVTEDLGLKSKVNKLAGIAITIEEFKAEYL